MRDQISLTVVVPAHNAASFIKSTLESVANLDPAPSEVIVVNDGSTDTTSQVVGDFIASGRLPQARLLEQEQQGVSAARNTGLDAALGDFVLFLDADDWAEPTLLARLRDAVAQCGSATDVIAWRFQHVDADGKLLGTFDRYFADTLPAVSSGPETLRRILLSESQYVWTGSVAYRRAFLWEHGLRFTEGCATGEDSEFIWKALSVAAQVAWVSESLSQYVRRPGSATSRVHVNRFDGVRAYQRAAEFMKERSDPRLADIAESVDERIIPRFMVILTLMASHSEDPRSVLRDLEVRHPGLTKDVGRMIGDRMQQGRKAPLSWRLFARTPRWAFRYLRAKSRWSQVRRTGARQRSGARKAVLYAYTRANLGDDMLIKVLADRYPSWRFHVRVPRDARAKEYTRPFRDMPNVRVFGWLPGVDGIAKRLQLKFRPNNWLWDRVERRSSVVVRLGGSIFIEPPDWPAKVALDQKRLGTGKPTFVLGCNFGPYKSEEFLEAYRELFSRLDDVCFRDNSSWETFRELDHVRLAPDIGLMTKLPRSPQSRSQSRPPRLGVSVIDLTDRPALRQYQDVYDATIVAVIRRALASEWGVRLAGFCSFEGDDKAVHRILDALGPDASKVDSYLYSGDLDGALEQLAGCTHWLATRFHATVIGWLSGANTVPLAYSRKTDDFLDFMGHRGVRFSVASLGDVSRTADEVFDALASPASGSLSGVDPDILSQRVGQSEDQFRGLDTRMARR